MPYELLKDDQKNQLGKNNEAKMTLYNALPREECEQVFMCKTAKEVWHTLSITHQGNSQVKNCKIDLLTQEYKNFSISTKETIDSGFTRFNAIVTSLKFLDPDHSSKNYDYLKRYVWYLDSGCSRHMTRVKQYIHRYSKESGPKVVFGDNSSGDKEGKNRSISQKNDTLRQTCSSRPEANYSIQVDVLSNGPGVFGSGHFDRGFVALTRSQLVEKKAYNCVRVRVAKALSNRHSPRNRFHMHNYCSWILLNMNQDSPAEDLGIDAPLSLIRII
ncbi:hypothetical protein Tco_0986969 [Tanacetum coccineum]